MKIGFYGFGHLALAVTEGILKKELADAKDIHILAKSEQTKSRARGLGLSVCDDGASLFACSDVVFLAIKPSVFHELEKSISLANTDHKRVVSLMACVSQEELERVFNRPVLRVMPTVAIKNGNDIIGATSTEGFEDVIALLGRLGSVQILDEEQLDRLTVAASCGPGFAAKALNGYVLACEQLGFSKEQAVAITSAVFSFAASAAGEDPFKTLEEQVATKGGVTEAGNLAMGDDIEQAFRAAFEKALEKATPKKERI